MNTTKKTIEGERHQSKVMPLLLCALFAALTAVCSIISVPLGPVPFNLATLAVMLTGGLLGWKYGPLSQAVFVLLGAVGLPIFAGFQAGPGVLAGPSGGYIIGYIGSAFVIGLVLHAGKKRGSWLSLLLALLAGELVCFTIGTCWFMFVMKSGLMAALGLCVFPFLIPDGLKLVAAGLLIRRLSPFTERLL